MENVCGFFVITKIARIRIEFPKPSYGRQIGCAAIDFNFVFIWPKI